MELQNFINENEDYLRVFKEHKLYVRKYSQLDLALVKCYKNNKYEYDLHPWLKYCRGAIINTKTNRLVCIPPMKSLEREYEIENVINGYNGEDEYQPLIEGTMINMFYHNDEWMISTRSNIGAKNSWEKKEPFCKLFLEVNGSEWFNELNKNYCYSFVLCHKKNRIVSLIEDNMIFLIENYELGELPIRKELKEITNINLIFNFPEEYLINYNNYLPFSIKGLTIKNKNKRVNWINPEYTYVEGLKMNYNDPYLNYIALRQKRLLKEYLKFFPEDYHIYNQYRMDFNIIKQLLYESYVSKFIRKEIEISDIKYPLRPLVFELHKFYKESGESINIKIVSDYLHNLPGKKMLFINNYLFKK
tara:strand:+ start:1032 stop:2111 length:1080 start_codon:yes stop_codon:yes gene_type:complete